MAKEEISTLLVGEQGKLLGIISEQDIIRHVVAKGKDPTQVPVTSEFNEVAKGDLGKMQAEHFSVKFLLITPSR